MVRFVFLAILTLPAFASAQEPAPTYAAPDLSGRWSGYWISDKNGHKGPLNARFRPQADGSYKVTYTGRFWVVFPFIYSTTMTPSNIGPDGLTLSASQNLGPLLGTFDTNAFATPTNFDAYFSAKGDTGRFVLRRR